MEVRKRLIMLATVLTSFATAAVAQLTIPADTPVMQAGASGSDVVDAVVDLIYHSCIFSEDYLFLRRLAYLETDDGKAPNTYMINSYYSGIWRTNKDMFLETQRAPSSQASQQALSKIQAAFGINWQSVRWEDLQKPLYSALAAGLHITYSGKNLQIPSSPNEQVSFWLSNFPSSVVSTIGWENTCSGTEQADVVFFLDSDTTLENFREMLLYIENVVDGLPVDNGNVRVALYQLGASLVPRNDLRLGTTITKSSVVATIKLTSQVLYGPTTSPPDIGNQLQSILSDAFASSSSQRPNAAKIIVLVTARHISSLLSLQEAGQRATREGVSVFTVGVGDDALMTFLAHVATQPECDHQIQVDRFSSLSSIAQQTQYKICKEPMIALGMIRCRLDQCRNLAFHMTSQDMTISATTTCSSGTVYVSARSPRPSGSYWDAKDTSNTAAASVTASSSYVYATFTEVPPGGSNCYVTIEAHNGKTTGTTVPPILGTIIYPTPNPCVGRTEERFPYALDSRMFIQCDLLDRMYLTVCPPEAPHFDPNCRYCVGGNFPSLASCTTIVTSGFCGLFSNPCTKYNLLNNNFFFACPSDNSKYLQCDSWGNAYLQSCPSSTVWHQDQLRCLMTTVTGVCLGGFGYVADPVDPHRYYLCDNQNAIPFTCSPAIYVWVQLLNRCESPFTYPSVAPVTPVTYYVSPVTPAPTQIVIGTGGLISRGFLYPCTHENILADKLYFPYASDTNKYIQCDLWGDAFLKSCQPGFYFFVESSTCV